MLHFSYFFLTHYYFWVSMDQQLQILIQYKHQRMGMPTQLSRKNWETNRQFRGVSVHHLATCLSTFILCCTKVEMHNHRVAVFPPSATWTPLKLRIPVRPRPLASCSISLSFNLRSSNSFAKLSSLCFNSLASPKIIVKLSYHLYS